MSGASDSVKLLVGHMKEADELMDNRVATFFDELLDIGVSSLPSHRPPSQPSQPPNCLHLALVEKMKLTFPFYIIIQILGEKMLGERRIRSH